MIDENNHKHSEDIQQPNHELIRTVTATVLQTLQATGNMPGSSQTQGKSSQEPKTVDLIGMFFYILEKFSVPRLHKTAKIFW